MVSKKWLFVGVFTLLSLSLAMAAPPAVHPTTGEPLVITCFRGTPDAIDGDLSDWNLDAITPAVVDAAAQLYTGQATWSSADDCSAKFYVLWDDTKIYIALVAKDDRLSMNKSGGDIWNADCAEVFFGTTNAVPPHVEHYQFGFNANNQIWNWCNMDSAGQALPNFMVAASARTPDGYICEVSIEHGRMSALSFVAGNTIGFHPCLDDTDATDRELQITWTGREAHDQSLGFGYLVLSSDPAVAKELSQGPSPADDAVDVPVDAVLSWNPGEYAAAHDVYFGTAFADVNNASRANPTGVLASQGQTATELDPEGLLEYGQTYYWRVDEVNAAPDGTIFKGETWSFTTESFGSPIANVTATASSFTPGMGPQNTVNGSGLNAGDEHSTELMQMWMSGTTPTPHWIRYEFDKVYKMHELWVWNSNQVIESFVGFGARNVTIEYSSDGATWTVLEGVPEFAQATSLPTYTANTTVSFGGVMAKFVKLTIDKKWGVAPQASLSEVRFFCVPVQARSPQPAVGATGVGVDSDLSWRPGREAESHVVYLGADQDAMAQVGTSTEHSYTPASLAFGTTYFWKVNEIGGAGPYEGDVWSFTTQEYAAIDDMESYNDDDNRIFDTWIDGWVNNTGSLVGYDVSPFAERVIIHGGKQSMPLRYDNAASPFVSEAEHTFDSAQNWSVSGADTLSLFVRGSMPAFAETASGSILMNGIGTDIWGTTDQFRYAYKTLTGNGTVVARVESIFNSNVWAKGGVMIRQSIEPGSTHAFMAITPSGGNGASFQRRLLAGQASTNNDSTTVVAAPCWAKVERAGNNFTASVSPDGKTWTQLGTAQTITMTGPVLIGLALCSHDVAVATAAEFSNVSMTGNVTGAWQVAEIGVAQPAGNSVESLYLTVKDSSGKAKTVVNPDTAATVRAGWVQWKIPLSEFTSAGVKMNAVKTMTIGVGNKAAPVKGGAGTVFIDDIGYGHSAQ